MTLNLDRLRQRIRERQAAPQNPTKPKLPDLLIKAQEEKAELLSAYKKRRAAKIERARASSRPFNKFLSILARELPYTSLIEPGVVDLDLDALITTLKLADLPSDVRFLALEEAHEFIRAVHKAETRSPVTANFDHLFDPDFVDSLAECRSALKLV